ncbi:MAG: GNAT family N-acetyltransferase [Bdellovibrionales bacterium]|nr:GNAT family N-acetyltransferase [Bdellovibrionales bacterium]
MNPEFHIYNEAHREIIRPGIEEILSSDQKQTGRLSFEKVLPTPGFSELIWLECEGRFAGFVSFIPSVEGFEVIMLGVSIAQRRKGLMTSLLKVLIEQLDAGQKVWLEVHSQNLGAIEFYKSFGFEHQGARPKYYSDGQDAQIFSFEK